MLETRKRLQVTTGQVTEKAEGRGRRPIRYERCRIAWEGKKRKATLLIWPSPSEACQEGDHPATGREKFINLNTTQSAIGSII